MSNQVITFVTDDNYLDHAKAFMVNCRRQGNWRGDFCAICPVTPGCLELQNHGVTVFQVPESEWNFMVKFWTFDPYFRRWEHALCIDLDVLVQDDIQKMFDRLSKTLPESISCDHDDGSILRGLQHWDEKWESHSESYSRLERKFPCVNSQMFNAAFIFYSPSSIPSDTRDQLLAINAEFREINPTDADQMLFNLLFYDRLRIAGKDAVCFFGHDYPENRVPSESRGWKGDEIPAILHYTRWHAPWIVKCICDDGNEMGGYRNHRLGRICHELYAENLAAFESEFSSTIGRVDE